jgi:ribosomal protein L3 glutamine methyltransferase
VKLAQLIDRTARRFRAAGLHYGHGTDNPRDEATWLVLRGLKLGFDADLRREADPREIEPLVQRRITERIPTAYLLGEAWLDGVPFTIDRRVIVPRSHIAEVLHEGVWFPPAKQILDVCTGSGCLAILAARAFPRATVVATDISPDALAVARRNIRRHRLAGRVRAVKADLFSGRGYDVILANPPYVPSATMRKLAPEYRWEPGIALAGGANGLDLIRKLLGGAAPRLTAQGILICEVGDGKRAVERAYPRVRFIWPRPEVFILERARMPAAGASASRRAAAPR